MDFSYSSVYQYPQRTTKGIARQLPFDHYSFLSFSDNNNSTKTHFSHCSTAFNDERAQGVREVVSFHLTVLPNHAEYGLQERDRNGGKPGIGRRVRLLGDWRARLYRYLTNKTASEGKTKSDPGISPRTKGYLGKGKWENAWLFLIFFLLGSLLSPV